jgi:RNA polymerase sigma-70 factor, ECF subfamily
MKFDIRIRIDDRGAGYILRFAVAHLDSVPATTEISQAEVEKYPSADDPSANIGFALFSGASFSTRGHLLLNLSGPNRPGGDKNQIGKSGMEENRPGAQQYPQTAKKPDPAQAMRIGPDAPQDDNQLLARIRKGDEQAFSELVKRHGDYLFGTAWSLLHDKHDAEEAVQETWAAVLSASFHGQSQVRTWLIGILVRQCALLRRKKARWRIHAEQIPPQTVMPMSNAVDAKLDLAVMLEKLSPEHREVIVLRELSQMSYAEMAQALHVPRGTIESRLHRAREQLLQLFEADMKEKKTKEQSDEL